MSDLPTHTPDTTPAPPAVGGSIQRALAGEIDWTVGAVISEAWTMLKGAKLSIWGAVLLMYIAMFLLAFVLGVVVGFLPAVPGLDILVQLVIALVTWPLSAGLAMIGIRKAAHLPVRASMVFEYYDRILPIFILYLAVLLLMMLGYALLILPGIYLSVSYILALPLMVEKNLDIWEAMETSRRAITKCWFRTFGLLLLMGLILFVSMIPLGIGLIWTVPMMILSVGILYREMFGVEPATQQAQ